MQKKALVTIQKLYVAASVISKVVAVICTVALVCSIVGIAVMAAVPSDTKIGENTFGGYIEEGAEESKETALAKLAASVVGLAVGVYLAKKAKRYFDGEILAGTPFTYEGAAELKKLGWTVIIGTFAASIFSATVYGILRLAMNGVEAGAYEYEMGAEIAVGISMLILSLVYRYGADVKGEGETYFTDKTDANR